MISAEAKSRLASAELRRGASFWLGLLAGVPGCFAALLLIALALFVGARQSIAADSPASGAHGVLLGLLLWVYLGLPAIGLSLLFTFRAGRRAGKLSPLLWIMSGLSILSWTITVVIFSGSW